MGSNSSNENKKDTGSVFYHLDIWKHAASYAESQGGGTFNKIINFSHAVDVLDWKNRDNHRDNDSDEDRNDDRDNDSGNDNDNNYSDDE